MKERLQGLVQSPGHWYSLGQSLVLLGAGPLAAGGAMLALGIGVARDLLGIKSKPGSQFPLKLNGGILLTAAAAGIALDLVTTGGLVSAAKMLGYGVLAGFGAGNVLKGLELETGFRFFKNAKTKLGRIGANLLRAETFIGTGAICVCLLSAGAIPPVATALSVALSAGAIGITSLAKKDGQSWLREISDTGVARTCFLAINLISAVVSASPAAFIGNLCLGMGNGRILQLNERRFQEARHRLAVETALSEAPRQSVSASPAPVLDPKIGPRQAPSSAFAGVTSNATAMEAPLRARWKLPTPAVY